MLRGELLNFLTEEAKEYRQNTLESLRRNRHMHNLSLADIQRLEENQRLVQATIDAILVDFINFVGATQCVDYGLYTKDLK